MYLNVMCLRAWRTVYYDVYEVVVADNFYTGQS